MRFCCHIGTFMVFFLITLFVPINSYKALAIDFQDAHIHGFVSQGWLKSDHNYYLADTEQGSFEFNEMGINFSSVISEKLRLGLQLLSKDMGEYGNNKVVIDWAMADYHFNNLFGVKAGRVKMPFGLYNQLRDGDMLRTSVLMPSGIYSEIRRDYNNAYNGISIYGTADFFGAADMNLELFMGTSDISSDSMFFKSTFERITKNSSRVMGIPLRYEYPDLKNNYISGASLSWNTPADGLKAAFSMMTASSDISCNLTNSVGINTAEFQSDIKISNIQIWSLEYTLNSLTLSTEWMLMRISNDITIHPSFVGLSDISFSNAVHSQSWYIQANYQWNDWLTFGLYYSEYYPDKEDKLGKNLNIDYFAWQKELVPTIRIDINKNWLVKLEAHITDGVALVNDFDNPNGMDRYWTLWTIKTTFNF